MIMAPHTVDFIVAGHDCQRSAFPNRNFKALQIDFPQCPLTDTGIVSVTACLLIVAGKMFGTRRPSSALNATDCSGGDLACKIRIFGIVFKISAAEGISVDIHTWCQQHMYTEMIHFPTDKTIQQFHTFLVKAARQCCTAGQQTDRSADPNAGGTVRSDHWWDTAFSQRFRYTSKSSCVSADTIARIHLALSVGQLVQFFGGKLGNKGIYGSISAYHFGKGNIPACCTYFLRQFRQDYRFQIFLDSRYRLVVRFSVAIN